MKLTTLSILLAVAIATASASPTLELRGGGRANGVSCNASSQCKSKSYCRHGKCDSQKPDGHVCYKDQGCSSGKCNNGKCGKKPPPPPAHPHPHPHPHPAPHPGPPGPPPPPGPPGPPPPAGPPSSGILSYVSPNAQYLGEVDVGDGDIEEFEVVQDSQIWYLADNGNLISPSGRFLATDGNQIGDLYTSTVVDDTVVAYVCSTASDSTPTKNILNCEAQVTQGDGASFSICSDGEVETGQPTCDDVVTTFAQLTLTATH